MRNLRYLYSSLVRWTRSTTAEQVRWLLKSESRICWIDIAPDKTGTQTTKYRMEHLGLLHGLTACFLHRWAPLYVVGSSNVIIRQQRICTPPKKKTMATIFWQGRWFSDGLAIAGWECVPKTNSRMATKAEDLAATSSRTRRGVDSMRLDSLIRCQLGSDVRNWLDKHAERKPQRSQTGP
ncbi:hypothetical protein PHMEG_00037658 [Phytophthora megakarya]|uniref:RNase H type-1 domain-containing protein n=1 Tax=Phytophthora megakarya TaxID=4795 RepID=A0A225UJ76_9STRA|nr:hypothetical protein PHMEG_00037658 [Phytophthora megakarya]